MENQKSALHWKQRLQKIQDILFSMPDSMEKAVILEETIQLWRIWKRIEELGQKKSD